MKEIRFTATEEEYAQIMVYVQAKRRWSKVGHFLRYAIFKEMDHNRLGRHDIRGGAGCAEPSGGQKKGV